jgi:hypothetical protein
MRAALMAPWHGVTVEECVYTAVALLACLWLRLIVRWAKRP